MNGVPPIQDSDAEDVVWALQTADALFRRGERGDALVWVRRAAQAAGEAGHDARAVELARSAVTLADSKDGGSKDARDEEENTDVISLSPEDLMEARASVVDETEVVVTLSEPPHPVATEAAPPASEVHAGMLDPWQQAVEGPPTEVPPATDGEPALSTTAEVPDVVTSAHTIPVSRPPSEPAPASPRSPGGSSEVLESLRELADACELAEGEEISVDGCVWVDAGEVALAPQISELPAAVLGPGDFATLVSRFAPSKICRAIGLAASSSLRLLAHGEVLAHADESTRALLRERGDRLLALLGASMGTLGEKLDPNMFQELVSKFALRPLVAGELLVEKGEPLPGLVLVGAGALSLRLGGAEFGELSTGEFLFAEEVMGGKAAPAGAFGGEEGALVWVADRRRTQELFATCPPLVEVLMG